MVVYKDSKVLAEAVSDYIQFEVALLLIVVMHGEYLAFQSITFTLLEAINLRSS